MGVESAEMGNPLKRLEDFLSDKAQGCEALSRAEAVKLHARWVSTFLTDGKWPKGVNNQFDWHVFSFEKQGCLEGDVARNEYRRLAQGSMCVLSSSRHAGDFAVRFVTRQGLNFEKLAQDLIVVPNDFSWSALFTHEAYHGPYFCRPAEKIGEEIGDRHVF